MLSSVTSVLHPTDAIQLTLKAAPCPPSPDSRSGPCQGPCLHCYQQLPVLGANTGPPERPPLGSAGPPGRPPPFPSLSAFAPTSV
eukprot:3264407-Amphidinium_carterae.1